MLYQAESKLGSRVRLSHRLLSIRRCASQAHGRYSSHASNATLDEWVATFQVDDKIKVFFMRLFYVINFFSQYLHLCVAYAYACCTSYIAQKIRSKTIVLAVQSFSAADILEASTSDAAFSHLNVSHADVARLRSIYYPPIIAVVLAYQNSCFKVSEFSHHFLLTLFSAAPFTWLIG